MLLYHQIRVGSQLLANEGSISSHVQLEEVKIQVYQQENRLNHDFREH